MESTWALNCKVFAKRELPLSADVGYALLDDAPLDHLPLTIGCYGVRGFNQ